MLSDHRFVNERKAISELQKELTEDLKKDNLHGSVSAAIVDKGRLIWAGAYGYASSDKDISADTGTIWPRASNIGRGLSIQRRPCDRWTVWATECQMAVSGRPGTTDLVSATRDVLRRL